MTEKAVTWHHAGGRARRSGHANRRAQGRWEVEATCRLAVSGSHSSEGLCWVVVQLPYVPLHGGQACAQPRAGCTARLTWGTVELRPAGRRPHGTVAARPRRVGAPSSRRRAGARGRRGQWLVRLAFQSASWSSSPSEISTRIRWHCRGCRRGCGPANWDGDRARSDLKGSEKRCPS